MRSRRIVAISAAVVIVASAAALAVATRGGAASGSTNLGGGAAIAPADAVAFVALDTDLSSGQWQAVDGLLGHFPTHDALVTQLRSSFEQHTKLSWSADVVPALGAELDLVVLPPAAGSTGAKPSVVGLTQASDQSALDALLRKVGHGIVSAQIGGWTAFSTSRDALDAVRSATAKLADDATYGAAVATLAESALVHAYANGAQAQQLVDSLRAANGTTGGTTSGTPLVWASADLVAGADGLRFDAYSRDAAAGRGSVPPAAPYVSSLVDEIPAGVLFVADFPVRGSRLGAVTVPERLQKLLGASAALPADLAETLGGETALYVRAGLPLPEVTLVTEPDDTAAATRALADVVRLVEQAATRAGLPGLPIVHDLSGGQLVISTSQQGIDEFRSGGPKLSADPGFVQAGQASGMPSATTGFVYADLAKAVPVLRLLAPLLGAKLPAALQGDLGALHTFSAFGTQTGDESSVRALLQVG